MTISKHDQAKADALEAKAKAEADAKADAEKARADTFDRFEVLGGTFRQAAGATTSAGFIYNAAARAGLLTEDDAKAVWERFVKGANNASVTVLLGNETHMVETETLDPNDASKISKFKNFARWQILHMGLDWFTRVQRLHSGIAHKARKASQFNSLASATSYYCDKAAKANLTDADIKAGKFEVTDDELIALMTRDDADKAATPAKLSDEDRAAKALDALNKAAKSGNIVGLMDLVKRVKECLAHHELTAKLPTEAKRQADQKAGYLGADLLVKLVAAA